MTKEKEKAFSISLSEEEDVALRIIAETPALVGMGLSRRALIRYAILEATRRQTTQERPATRKDIEEVLATLTLSKVPRQPKESGYVPKKKATDEDKDELGMGICEALGGTVTGRSCSYTTYEVLASGRAVEYDKTIPLASLSESDVAKQYDPSREAWMRAKNGEATS